VHSEDWRTEEPEQGGFAEAGYSGPADVATFVFANHTVKLVRPSEPDRLLDDPGVLAWNRRDDYMPYWAYLWPSAYLLAERVVRGPEIDANNADNPAEAVEIGCGLGLAGLAALARGARVHFTDYDPAPLRFVARSAIENGFDRSRFTTRLLDWRDLPDERFPLILAADVLYEARLIPLIANLLDRMLTADGFGLIATPYRGAAEGFPAALAERSLQYHTDAAQARGEDGRLIQGTIYRVSRA